MASTTVPSTAPSNIVPNITSLPTKHPTAFESLGKVLGSKVIDMQGSEARDNLANERTFLAWIRTGFATAALGIVIARFRISTDSSSEVHSTFYKILSLLFLGVGMLCVVAGSTRYAHVQVLMQDGKFPTNGVATTLVAILGLGAFLATFVIMIL